MSEIPEGCPLHPHIEEALTQEPGWGQRNRALLGFLIASLIFSVLMYAMLFDARGAEVKACEARNVTRTELNERGVAIDSILTVLIRARQGPDAILRGEGTTLANRQEVADLKASRFKVDSDLPLLDCDEVFPRPWPFG